MPARRYGGGGGTTRRKHSLGNLRRAHPASGATWNVQVVRGKMSSKCLWHACRALVLGLTLMLLGAGMATLGYYADHLSTGSELRGNVTVRVKNDLKGFHLNNFSYVGPIVMGFGGFIVVASCVMTFEARDSAAKVVPARLRAGGGSKTTVRSNQGSAASQRRSMGMQLQNTRWDHHFGVFRSSPADGPCLPLTGNQTHHHHHHQQQQPFDRDALTAELIKFSKSLSASARFSPQLQQRRLTYTGSVPNLHTATITTTTTSTTNYHQSTNNHAPHPLDAYTTNLSHALISPYHKMSSSSTKRHHRHHHNHHHYNNNNNYQYQYRRQLPTNPTKTSSSVRRVKQTNSRGVTRISNSSSLIQRTTRESNASGNANVGGIGTCTLLQPPGRVYWQASSFDESAPRVLPSSGGGGGGIGGSGDGAISSSEKRAERTRRSDTAKRHVLARQKPIEHEEERCSPLGHRRNSTMSESSYSGRWTARCASMTSRTSSIDSRRIQVDLHSPEVMPKSILRSPKRYSSGPSATPSVEREFRSQLSVCSEPPAALRHQLSGQSSLEPCVPEETLESMNDERSPCKYDNATLSISMESNTYSETGVTELVRASSLPQAPTPHSTTTTATATTSTAPPKKTRPDTLALNAGVQKTQQQQQQSLCRSNSSRTFYRPKPGIVKDRDDSIFYIKSCVTNNSCNDIYDQVQVINERRTTLLKADSEQSLGSAERKLSSFSLKMPEITERENSVDMEEPPLPPPSVSSTANNDTVLQVEPVLDNAPTAEV